MELSKATTQDLVAELLKRNDLIKSAMNRISWDNWENEDKTHYKLGDVYFCKLDWIMETLDEDDEAYDTLQDIQETICPILNLLDNE